MDHRHPIPAELIATAELPWPIGDTTIDFSLRFTVFGEVLSVDCPFLALPEPAQRMMVGREWTNCIRDIKYFKSTLRYILPLLAMGYGSPHERWQPIRRQLEAMAEQEGYQPLLLHHYILDKWVKVVWQLRRASQQHLLDIYGLLLFQHQLGRAVKSIPHGQELFFVEIFQELSAYRRLAPEEREQAYRFLGRIKRRASITWLLGCLEDPARIEDRVFIFRSLSSLKSRRIRQTLVEFYEQHPGLDQLTTQALLQALKNYRHDSVKAIFLREMDGECVSARKLIFDTLLRLGVTQPEIAARAKEILRKRESLLKVEMALWQFHTIPNDYLSPDGEVLLEIWDWAAPQQDGHRVIRLLPKIMEKSRVREPSLKALVNQLPAASAEERAGVFTKLAHLGNHRQVRSILACIREGEEHLVMNRAAFQAVERILTRKPRQEVLPLLLFFLQEGTPFRLQTEAIKAMTPILKEFRHDRRPIGPLLRVLQDSRLPLQMEALSALQYFLGRRRVRKAVKRAMEQDPELHLSYAGGKVRNKLRHLAKERKEIREVILSMALIALLIMVATGGC